jgi:hypothetical protein
MTERDTEALEARIKQLEAELLQLQEQERHLAPPGLMIKVKILVVLVWGLLLVSGVSVLHWVVGWPR